MVLLALAMAVGPLGVAAYAQTGYPGTTSTAPPQPTEERQSAGQVRPRETVVIESCGFVRGGTVEVSFNGSTVGSDIAGEDGCVDVQFTVRTDCPGVIVNGLPREGRRGRNEVVVSGPGSNGASRTVTTGVTISCSSGGRVASSSSERSGDLGRSMAEPEDGVVTAAPDARGQSVLGATFGRALAATGSQPGRVAFVGFALMLAGGALVVADRRWRQRRAGL